MEAQPDLQLLTQVPDLQPTSDQMSGIKLEQSLSNRQSVRLFKLLAKAEEEKVEAASRARRAVERGIFKEKLEIW